VAGPHGSTHTRGSGDFRSLIRYGPQHALCIDPHTTCLHPATWHLGLCRDSEKPSAHLLGPKFPDCQHKSISCEAQEPFIRGMMRLIQKSGARCFPTKFLGRCSWPVRRPRRCPCVLAIDPGPFQVLISIVIAIAVFVAHCLHHCLQFLRLFDAISLRTVTPKQCGLKHKQRRWSHCRPVNPDCATSIDKT
jgi:hypothetical protein